MAVPASSVSMIEPGYVRQRAAALVLEGKDARVLVLRALPRWDGEPTLQLDGRTVHVRAGISQLAILNAYAELPDGDYLVVLTDRSRQDLGDAVLTRAWRGDVELPDLWEAVPALFRARGVTREVRRIGPWVPAALLAHSPTAGWPASPGPEVTADFALSNLIAHLLGLPLPETLDPDLVLNVLGAPAGRAAWTAVDPALRGRLVDWAAENVGPAVAFALRAGSTSRAVAPLAVGLAVEALANGDVSTGQQRGQAAGLLFARHLGGATLSTAEARDVGRAARVAVSRRMVTEPDGARNLLAQAQALLGDLGWAEGAIASDLLPAGLLARLRAVGASLEKDADGAETALRHLLDHMLARPDDATVLTARMAVRLARWLRVEESAADTLAASLRRHLDEGAWVDRALGLVWQGSEDPELSARYAALVTAVRARRTEQDRAAALQLATHASFPHPVEGAVAIEDVLSQVVEPWSVGEGVLLVVLDGMSASVSTEVAEAAQELGLVEWVPNNGRRMCALAALPSLTEISRATLLSGVLTKGSGSVEKKGLAAAFPGALLFHKDDLRAAAGEQLPTAVIAAVAATGTQPVVGLVINTIDDTLHKQDPSSTRWTLDRLNPLRSLLSEARTAGRTVILTSDHGHVVERTTEARSVPGASARWREVATGPTGEGEVVVSGRRVLTPSHEAVLLWCEDVHYGPRQTGYHGGASLAEVTVPVIVLRTGFEVQTSRTAGPAGWKPAAPQAPEWWNEPARAVASQTPVAPTVKKAARPKAPRPDTPLFELEEAITAVKAEGDMADAVLASATYAAQRTRAGRRTADDATVAAVLRALLSRSNRCHRDTLATAVGVPAGSLEPTLAAVKRLLNIDGYPVIEQDADQVTLKLDEALLREQFELGGS